MAGFVTSPLIGIQSGDIAIRPDAQLGEQDVTQSIMLDVLDAYTDVILGGPDDGPRFGYTLDADEVTPDQDRCALPHRAPQLVRVRPAAAVADQGRGLHR